MYFTSYSTPTERTMSVVVSKSHIWLLKFVCRFFACFILRFWRNHVVVLSFTVSFNKGILPFQFSSFRHKNRIQHWNELVLPFSGFTYRITLINTFYFQAKWMFWSIKLDFLLPEIKICHQTSETFVSLRDMGIPINEGWVSSYTSCWQILVYFNGVPQYPLAERRSPCRVSFSKCWLYNTSHFSSSTPHK